MNDNTSNPAQRYVLAIFALVLLTLAATPLLPVLDLANIVMLYLLGVFLIALRLGRGPAIVSAVLAVLLFDVFFVPPRFSLAVHDAQYLVTFAVMLVVGLISSHLTARLQEQSAEAIRNEQLTRKLYQLAKELAGAGTTGQVIEIVDRSLTGLGYQARLFRCDTQGQLPDLQHELILQRLALAALQQSATMSIGQFTASGMHGYVVPIKSSHRDLGVLMVHAPAPFASMQDPGVLQLEAIADLVAISLERLYFVDLAQSHELEVSSERLRSSILSALSHDLRTPLAGMTGMADALALSTQGLDARVRERAAALREQARTMNNLLSNLLDMARLHAGKVTLRQEWQLFEDVIGAAVNLLKPALFDHEIRVELEPGLPLVRFDAVLLERVLCNLLENAAKFSPAGSPIELKSYVFSGEARIEVSDCGPGFPAGPEDRWFTMFQRGEGESSRPGVGMGLAICKAIMDAHHGRIWIGNGARGGAIVTLALPLGTPPELPTEPEDAP